MKIESLTKEGSIKENHSLCLEEKEDMNKLDEMKEILVNAKRKNKR